MDRRVAGLVVLVATLISMLVLGGITGREVAGSAVLTPAPAAPQAGDCVRQSDVEWIPISCTSPHTAEVVQGWTALSTPGIDVYDKCITAARQYLPPPPEDGTPSATWSAPPVMSTTMLVSGPGRDQVSHWSWQACVIRPIISDENHAGYRGRLRDVTSTGNLPVELRRCFVRPGTLGVVGISCAQGHLGEILAARQLRVFTSSDQLDDTSTNPEVNAQCRGIARRATATSDPTYGGRLAVVVNLHATGMGFVVSIASRGEVSQSYVLYEASCSVESVSGHELYASVVGLGARPLPIR